MDSHPHNPGARPLRLALFAATLLLAPLAGAQTINHLSTIDTVSSTVPPNGDQNPYGVARVPSTRGHLTAGSFLISNFNNASNAQGTGTTIVQIEPSGNQTLFAAIDPAKVSCPGGVGLTTALVALRSGFVIVGSLPTVGGDPATSQAGCLLVLDSWGHVIRSFSGHGINGPWDMTAIDLDDYAVLFVSNVLNGTVAANGSTVHRGTVLRLLLSIPDGGSPRLLETRVIANAFPEKTDPAALVIGPTGLAFDERTGNLYVADTLGNRIAVVPNALFRLSPSHAGSTLAQGGSLNGPLGLTLTPDHLLIAANGGDGNLVEFSRTGVQLATKTVDTSGPPPGGAGALFGLVAVPHGVYFVDDAANTFNRLH